MFTETITESLKYLSVYSLFLSFNPFIDLFLVAGASLEKKLSFDLNVSLISTPLISNNLSLISTSSGAGYWPEEFCIIKPFESKG